MAILDILARDLDMENAAAQTVCCLLSPSSAKLRPLPGFLFNTRSSLMFTDQCGNSALYCGNACQPLAGTCPPYTPDGTCGNGCSCLGSPHGECCGPDFKCGSGQFACGSLCKFQWGTCKIMPGTSSMNFH